MIHIIMKKSVYCEIDKNINYKYRKHKSPINFRLVIYDIKNFLFVLFTMYYVQVLKILVIMIYTRIILPNDVGRIQEIHFVIIHFHFQYIDKAIFGYNFTHILHLFNEIDEV